MPVVGKIGFALGTTPYDAYAIKFSRDGTQQNLENVASVYYVDDARKAVIQSFNLPEDADALHQYLEEHCLVWGIRRKLLAGDKLVAIEYVPSVDTTVQTIEIFTTSSQGDNNKARVKIIHESGLYIAAFNADNGPDAATEYDLTGYKRYVNNQSVSLKAGQKYYIVYQHDDANPGEDTFWPAFFEGEKGNYKEYSNNRDTVTTTDITTLGTYGGEAGDLSTVVPLSENDYFVWEGSNSIFEQHACYIRSNAGNGKTYKGELGVNTGDIRAEDIIAFCAMLVDDSFRFMPQNGPIFSGRFAYKSSNTPSDVTDYGSKNTAALRLANLLKDIKSYTSALCTSGPSSWEYGWNASDIIGHVFKMQSGYTSQISSLTPIDTLPTNPINGGFYFIKGGTISGDNDDNVYYYDGSWKKVYNYTTLSSMIDNSGTYGDYMTEIGTSDDLVKQKISGEGNISTTIRSATTYNDRKYYLKINGNEV